ncbi:hypothetical protein JG687_00015912 [Phytophthora cactorum]|uniref:Uncharacterized protein n=1 Tax=Phytophthora cactorum TaxID=29920 RepID=A0A8T1TSF8_9STRA|nr:hypothetical protein JG687_00015912 [Phytophthora cactorum]
MEQLWLSRSKPNGRAQARSELHHHNIIDSSTKSIRVPYQKMLFTPSSVTSAAPHTYVTSTQCMPPALLCLCPVFGDTGAQKWTFITLS